MDQQNTGNQAVRQAAELRALLDETYSLMECRKALVIADNDQNKAIKWLVEGGWMAGKLVSWNFASLTQKAEQLSAEFGIHADKAMAVLKNCGGNLNLAKKVLTGQPLC